MNFDEMRSKAQGSSIVGDLSSTVASAGSYIGSYLGLVAEKPAKPEFKTTIKAEDNAESLINFNDLVKDV